MAIEIKDLRESDIDRRVLASNGAYQAFGTIKRFSPDCIVVKFPGRLAVLVATKFLSFTEVKEKLT